MKPITICIRLPNWLGDVCMALPVIRAIQQKHPDAQFTFLSHAPFLDLLDKLGIAGEKVALPKKSLGYFLSFLKWRRARFDVHILFTNSERGDLEALLMGSRTRYGIARHNKPRKWLTHRYELGRDFDEETLHQTFLWRDFTQHFDLHDGVDLSPCLPAQTAAPDIPQDTVPTAVGLICGSANTPEKRWPVDKWQALGNQLLARGCQRIVLIGTKDDSATCEKVATFLADPRVENLAGKTNLSELTERLLGLSLVIGNDTGGLHVANALDVPVIGLYGYTNPVRCHPIFEAPLHILQSPKGYGEGIMDDISVERVLDAVAASPSDTV